jgi:hypothetical protein
MTPTKPKTYGDAVAKARDMVAAARVADPGEHFPYHRGAVEALLDANEPMPVDDAGDDDRTVHDYTSQAIVEASERTVDAQEAYLTDATETNRTAYYDAQDALVAARREHRAHRTGTYVGARARRAGE